VKGAGDQIDYGLRVYDPRVGRFLSVDPLLKSFPWWSPYQFAGNSPISNLDLDGLESFPANRIRGMEGERFIRTRLKISNEYEVWEQVTVRPASGIASDNSRIDF
jgi:hypothetical protein